MIDARHLSRASRAAVTAFALVVMTVQATAWQSPASAVKPSVALSAAERRAVDNLKTATIREAVEVLSSREMEGRGTATAGGERAAKWIADRFKALGLEPAGADGTYFQAVPFREKRVLPGATMSVAGTSLAHGTDFLPFAPIINASVETKGELVLAGYGVTSTDLKRDDFSGIDLKGKIAVVFSGRPANADAEAWQKAGGQQAVFRNLVSRGVAGIVLAGYDNPSFPFDRLAAYVGRRSISLATTPVAPMKLPATVYLSNEGAAKLFTAAGADFAALKAKASAGEAVSRALGAEAAVSVQVELKEVTGSNVAAVLRGSSEAHRDEAVLYTAHYDAFGLGDNGTYYPGAADNALGVGEIIAIAEAAAKASPRPARSMLFLAVTGEEYGLLGAEHWAQNPTWPLEKVVANVNYDGIGTEVFGPVKEIVGFGREYSSLGPILEAIAPAVGTTLIEDPMPEEKAFYRSDHYAFVKRGVPALMLLGAPASTKEWIAKAREWIETDYHQPTDTIKPTWNWEGPRTVAVVGLLVGLRVASADAKAPVWNAGSPFQRPVAASAATP